MTCAEIRSSIPAAAINPFHTDRQIVANVQEHIQDCPDCKALYEKNVAEREALGHDPTHTRV